MSRTVKSTFLSLDSRTVLHNPLYKAFKAKSFTDKDIMLHFYILDILKNKSLSSSEIADEIANEYFSMFESVKECDESTIRKKLNEYEKLGLIKGVKNRAEKRIYSLNECDVDLDKWRDALSFLRRLILSELSARICLTNLTMKKIRSDLNITIYSTHLKVKCCMICLI